MVNPWGLGVGDWGARPARTGMAVPRLVASGTVVLRRLNRRDLRHYLAKLVVAASGCPLFEPLELKDTIFKSRREQLLDGNVLLSGDLLCALVQLLRNVNGQVHRWPPTRLSISLGLIA